MDFVRSYFGKNEPLTSWTLFSSLFGRISADQCWSGQKVRKKVFNWSEVHFYQTNFLQNPYFSGRRFLLFNNEPPYSDDNLSLRRKTALALVGAPKTKVRIYRGTRMALNVYKLIAQKIVQKIVQKNSRKLSRKSSRKQWGLTP